MPNTEPTRNPKRHPMRCISIAAGNTDSITPRCCKVIGSVAQSAICGMLEIDRTVDVNIIVFTAWPSAW